MTGFRHSSFRHRCESNGCYIEALPWWNDIAECFPRGIIPTDIDGMVEIGGHILFLEEKSIGKHIDEGQRKALKALSSKDNVTVVVFRPGLKSEMEMLVFREGTSTDGWQKVTRVDFLEWLRHWAFRADSSRPESLRERVALLEAENHALKLEIFAMARPPKKTAEGGVA